jgi:predicted DNA-binding transcriptional regulator AlpA
MSDSASVSVGAGAVLKALLSPAEVEAEYGFPVATLKYWRYLNQGPKYMKTSEGPGGSVLYRRSEIETWIDEHTVQTQAALLLPGRPWGRRRSGWGPPSPSVSASRGRAR